MGSRLATGVVLVTGLAGLAGLAGAGQIMVRKIKLAEAVAQTEVAVVIQLEAPAGLKVDYPVPRDDEHDKDCAPYSWVAWRGRVESVVFPARFAPVEVGQVVTVVPAGIDRLVAASHLSCSEGGSRSWAQNRLDGEHPSDGARLVVLLRWSQQRGWMEAVDGGWLAARHAGKVRRAAGKARRALEPAGQYRIGSSEGPQGGCLGADECTFDRPSCPGPCGSCPGLAEPVLAMSKAAATRLRADCARQREPPPRKKGAPAPPAAPNCAPCPAPPPGAPRKAPVPTCVALRCGGA